MSSPNRPIRLNRTLLALGGVVLLAAGGFVLATGFGVLHLVDDDAALVPGTARPPTWVLYVTVAAAVVVALLAARWIVAQLARAPKTRTWQLEPEPVAGRTELVSTVAADPIAQEIAAYDGVHAAHAALTGDADRPALALVVSVTQGGDLTVIRERIHEYGVPRLCQALEVEQLPVTVEFRFTTTKSSRVH